MKLARHPSYDETDPRRSPVPTKQARSHSLLTSHTTIFYPTSFSRRSSIRLFRGWTIMESADRENQQGPEQDYDTNDGGVCGDEHLWHDIHIPFNYFLYRCPLFIQPARVVKKRC